MIGHGRFVPFGLCLRLLRWGWVALFVLGTALQGGVLAQFRTVLGDVEVELLENEKPVTVANFVRYVQSGVWTNMFLHRLDPAFVVQGGGYAVSGLGTTNASVVAVPRFPAIPNEFAAGARLSNRYGTLAMAKLGGDTNSANAEWFFNLADNTFLDSANTNSLFVVFGRVVRGTNVLNQLRGFVAYAGPGTRRTNVVANFGSPLNELPLLSTNMTYADLIYVDVSLLGVQVQHELAGERIAWSSMAGRTNRVEFTRSFPPVWEVLLRTNGSGARMTTLDPAPDGSRRFYRVLVEY